MHDDHLLEVSDIVQSLFDLPGNCLTYNSMPPLDEEMEQTLLGIIDVAENTQGTKDNYILKSLIDLGSLYFSAHQYQKADPILIRALSLARTGGNEVEEWIICNVLGALCIVTERLSDAENYALSALETAEKSTVEDQRKDEMVGGSLKCLYTVYMMRGLYIDAEQILQRHIAIVEKTPDLDELAELLTSQGFCFIKTGRYAEAELLYQRSLQIIESAKGTDHHSIAKILYGQAQLCQIQGHYNDAESLYLRAITIIEQAHVADYDLVAYICDLSSLYIITANYSGAKTLLSRTLEMAEKFSGVIHHTLLGIIFSNLATIYSITGHYAKSEKYSQQAMQITEKIYGEYHSNMANKLNNLAVLYNEFGRYDESEALLKRSIGVFEKTFGSNYPEFATSLNNLAMIYSITGRYAEAEKYSQQAMQITEKIHGEYHPDMAKTLNNIAALYIKFGRHAESEALLNRAICIHEKAFGPQHPDAAIYLSNLSFISLERGCYEEAEKYIMCALFIEESSFGSDHPSIAASLNSLARIYAETNRNAVSILLRKRAVNILQKVRQDVSRLGKETLSSYDSTISNAYQKLSELLIEAGQYGEAEYVMGMLKEKEHFELLRRDIASENTARSVSYSATEAPLIASMLEFSKSLSFIGKQLESLKKNKNRSSQEELELSAIKAQLVTVNQNYASFLDSLNDSLGPVTAKTVDQESNMMIDIADLGSDTAAIVTLSGAEKLHTIFVTSHGRIAFSSPIGAKELGTKIISFRELLKNPDTNEYLPLAQELYQHIIKPLEEELKSGGFTTILWMLDGALRLLPLASLHDGTQFLAERLQNVCITTKSKIGLQHHQQWNGLGMGVTRGYEGHASLPSVKDELDGIICEAGKGNINGILPGEILLDDEFTRQAMESHLEEGFKAVHFASHFELNPFNETLSYLLLGDGSKIRMDELRCLPTLFKGVDLVAFSACSTGLGTASTSGREVDGIGYLGEMQGAKTVMATLWPVEDKSTSLLMREFYKLREEGMTKGEALRQAQLSLLRGKFTSEDGHDFTHPYFWAPFILIGNAG